MKRPITGGIPSDVLLEKLLTQTGLPKVLSKRDLTAVKIHFGEMGNSAFVRPVYVREIIKMIRKTEALPFLTDANTLYAGTRGNSAEHIETAIKNGFAYSVVEAPIIIADGVRGRSQTGIHIQQKHFKTVYIGSEIVNADADSSHAGRGSVEFRAHYRLNGELNVHAEYGYLVNEKTAHTIVSWWRGLDARPRARRRVSRPPRRVARGRRGRDPDPARGSSARPAVAGGDHCESCPVASSEIPEVPVTGPLDFFTPP